MRTQFTSELNEFYDKLLQLGNVANEAVKKAMTAYNQKDKNLAESIISDDSKINHMVEDIETEAYRLIALQQPVSDDLRKIFTVLLASTDLERIADHAVGIAKAVTRFSENEKDVEAINKLINDMAEKTQDMLSSVILSFEEGDESSVREIAERDHEIDALLKELYQRASHHMEENVDVVNYGINHLNVGKSLERIGDYTTNMCERFIYLTTGDIVDLNN